MVQSIAVCVSQVGTQSTAGCVSNTRHTTIRASRLGNPTDMRQLSTLGGQYCPHLNLVMSSLSGPFSCVPGIASTAYSFQRAARSEGWNSRAMVLSMSVLHSAWCSIEMRLRIRINTHSVLDPVLHSKPSMSAQARQAHVRSWRGAESGFWNCG